MESQPYCCRDNRHIPDGLNKSTGVAPRSESDESVACRVTNCASERILPGFKNHDTPQKSKISVSGGHKKDLCPPNYV